MKVWITCKYCNNRWKTTIYGTIYIGNCDKCKSDKEDNFEIVPLIDLYGPKPTKGKR